MEWKGEGRQEGAGAGGRGSEREGRTPFFRIAKDRSGRGESSVKKGARGSENVRSSGEGSTNRANGTDDEGTEQALFGKMARVGDTEGGDRGWS